MPVYRFKTFDDAARALWTTSTDPALPGRLRRLWAFSARLVRRRVPPGVRRYRSIEEAQRERASWVTERPAG